MLCGIKKTYVFSGIQITFLMISLNREMLHQSISGTWHKISKMFLRCNAQYSSKFITFNMLNVGASFQIFFLDTMLKKTIGKLLIYSIRLYGYS